MPGTQDADLNDARPMLFLGLAVALLAVEYVPGVIAIGDLAQEVDPLAIARGPEGALRQAALLAIGAWGLATLVRGLGQSLRLWTVPAAIALAYLALAVASAAWADEPGLAARRALGFALMMAGVLAVARRLSVTDLPWFALLASACFVLLALAHESWNGTFLSRAEAYRFSGVFHPNALGGICAVLALAAGSIASRRKATLLFVLVALVAVWLLSLTRSRTALAGVVAGLGAAWASRARLSRAVFALLCAGWLACGAFLFYGDTLLPRLGNAILMNRADSEAGTLTGRTDLWRALLPYVAERPLLGYGLGGFWTADHAQQLRRSQGWAPAHAHSTYVAHALSLGVVGLVAYLFLLGGGLFRAFRLARDTGETFFLSLLVYVAVLGLAETVEPYPSFLTFLFFCVLALEAFQAPAATSGVEAA